MIALAFLPSWTTFSLLVSQQGAKSELANLSLNQEASQKELEEVCKMARWRTLPRRYGSSKSAAKKCIDNASSYAKKN
jgi:hypothetical protein